MFVEFSLVGQTDLLLHADDVEASDLLKEWRSDPENKNSSVPGDDRSPPWTWQTYLYRDETKLVWPFDNVMVGLRQAGAQMILKKQKTFKEMTQTGFIPTTEFCSFLVGGEEIQNSQIDALRDLSFAEQAKAVRDLGFLLFIKRARVGQGKHVRVRARFKDWRINGKLQINDMARELTPEVIERIFDIAGRLGHGDWRPGCKTPGIFGQYQAKLKFTE